MAYFGVSVSPKPRLESKLTQQPDLLQFNTKYPKPVLFKQPKTNPATTEPTYENVDVLKKEIKKHKTEFDSSILDELTKAADQIMQAVNGYVDDERTKSGTDDDRYNKQPLDTISETKSWKRDKTTTNKKQTTKYNENKTKLKCTSSNSSIESFTRECRKSTSTPIKRNEKASFEKQQRKKNSVNDTTTVKALTRARRLQRASSREALLQSHGSSSEDLPANNEIPIRKPRLLKKTKTAQLTMTNGIEIQKKTNLNNKKQEDPYTKNERYHNRICEIR